MPAAFEKVIRAIRSRVGSESIVSSGIAIFAVQLLGTGIGLLAHIFISNSIADSEYGTYTYVSSWIEILTLTSVLGMNIAVLRFHPIYLDDEQAAYRLGLSRFARVFVLLFSLATLAVFSAACWLLPFENASASYRLSLQLGGFAAVIVSQNMITNAMLRAMRRPVTAMALPQAGRPIAILILFFLLTVFAAESLTATYAMLCYLIATVLIGGVGGMMLFLSPDRRRNFGVKAKYEIRRWTHSASAMALASGFRVTMVQCNVIMLGFFVDMAYVGQFSSAVRIANLTTFGLTATNFVVAPMISAAYAKDDMQELQKTLKTAAQLILLISLPIVLGVIVAGPWILTRWGDEFIRAYPCLVILCLGQLFNALCGCVGYLLSMTGRERVATKILGFAGLLNIALNAILIPWFGIYGAAVASMVATVFWNSWMLLHVRRHMSVNPTLFPMLSSGKATP